MAVDRVNAGKQFHSDKEQSQRAAEANIKFIKDNFQAFKRACVKQKDIDAVKDFIGMISRGEPFRPNQKSYIDGLYDIAICEVYNLKRIKNQKYKNHLNLKA